MKNFTGGENPQTIAELYCSLEFTGEVHGELVFLSVINIFLSTTAFLGNSLILFALRKDTSIHPSSKLLYRNLAITDHCRASRGVMKEFTLGKSLINVNSVAIFFCRQEVLTVYKCSKNGLNYVWLSLYHTNEMRIKEKNALRSFLLLLFLFLNPD